VSWSPTKGDDYRCKRNDKPLVFDESARENYSYPWQDNFCETRDFEVGQCATGMGHQGQDIRPSSCCCATTREVSGHHPCRRARRGGVRGRQQSVYLSSTGATSMSASATCT